MSNEKGSVLFCGFFLIWCAVELYLSKAAFIGRYTGIYFVKIEDDLLFFWFLIGLKLLFSVLSFLIFLNNKKPDRSTKVER